VRHWIGQLYILSDANSDQPAYAEPYILEEAHKSELCLTAWIPDTSYGYCIAFQGHKLLCFEQ